MMLKCVLPKASATVCLLLIFACLEVNSFTSFLPNPTTSIRRGNLVLPQQNAIAPAKTRTPTTATTHSTTRTHTTTFLQIQNDPSNEFIESILNPPGDPNSPNNKYTHMIAIPVEQNHDLLLELESVQRGILYHCPLLIQSCVASVVMRMPLLLIDTSDINSDKASSSSGISTDDLFGRSGKKEQDLNTESLLTGRDPNTKAIHEIVNNVVDELIYTTRTSTSTSTSLVDGDGNGDEELKGDEREGKNGDNVQPIIMKFKGLEIDGDANEILHAIGTEDSSTPLIRRVLDEITKRLEARGWRVYLPEDEPQGKNGGLAEDGVTWRPRIPFMRLPLDFFEALPAPKGYDGNWENYSDEAKDCYMRVPEEGGNGISPIFWYKWWEDKLCNGNGVRLRELAVYGRTGPMGTSEQAFYIPHLRTKLPDGNAQLRREEKQDKNYNNMRRSEEEINMDFDGFDESDEAQSFEKEMANFKSTADRRMLQTVYDLSPSEAEEVGDIAETMQAESFEELQAIKDAIIDTTSAIDDGSGSITTQAGPSSELMMRDEFSSARSERADEIIGSIAKPFATGDWTNQAEKKKKPLPQDNPILKNWKERVTMAAKVQESSVPREILTPYPSDEHFAGIWCLISSPGGVMMDEEDLLEAVAGDSKSKENLILRIDGTTAGGPILDVENGHRAAGGTWKFFQAEWCGEDGAERQVQTRLRVRLLIPPLKTNVLVMEGEIKRGSIVSAESISKDNARELFSSSSFGMNKMASKNDASSNADEEDKESYMFVAGEAWVENASGTGSKQRSKLGRFSLMKRQDRNPDQYQYNIPAPTRYQD